jgi:PilZ domain
VATDERCEIATAVGARTAMIVNVSVEGLYVALDPPLPEIGTVLEVRFSLTKSDRIQCQARVTWQNPQSTVFEGIGRVAVGLPPGCGLELGSLGPGDRKILERFVEVGLRRGSLVGVRSVPSL